MSGQTNGQGDTLIHGGKKIAHRRDYVERIEALVTNEGMTADEAWLDIQRELISLIERDAAKKAGRGPSRNAPANGGAKVTNVAASDGRLNGNLIDFDGLPDEAVPPEIKGTGMTVLDAIASGQLDLGGAHPAAELLKRAIGPSKADAELAQKQIELDLPNLQYPTTRQTVRVMPSDFNRTSLFHVGANNLARRFCKNELLGRVGDGVRIYYQGEELRQTDEAVFRQLVHAARGNKPWEWIGLRRCNLIKGAKGTDRHLSARDAKEYREIIMRLRSGVLVIQSKKRGAFITCNLLSEFEGNDEEQRVRIDPRIALLFDSYAALDEDIIYSISGVAAKIYNFLQTIPHAGIHPILIKNLYELCYGRIEYQVREQAAKPKKADEDATSAKKRAEVAISKKYSDFRRKNLPMALDELKKKQLIISYEINHQDDKVAIVKNLQLGPSVQEVSAETLTP